MRQLVHTDSAFTLRVYAHSMSGGAGERERLKELACYEAFGETRSGSKATAATPPFQPNGSRDSGHRIDGHPGSLRVADPGSNAAEYRL